MMSGKRSFKKEFNTNGRCAERRTPTVLKMNWPLFQEVIRTIGNFRAESGGPIGGNENQSDVTRFYFDEGSRRSCAAYSPDYNLLNRLFKDEWNPAGVRLYGFIHSHPGYMSCPSFGDEDYAKRILDAIEDLDCLWLPIVNTVPDTGEFRLTPWVVFRAIHGVKVLKGKIQIVGLPSDVVLPGFDLEDVRSIKPNRPLDEIVLRKERYAVKNEQLSDWPTRQRNMSALSEQPQSTIVPNVRKQTGVPLDDRQAFARFGAAYDSNQTFARVQTAYDLEMMRWSRILAVGAGGAASWLEELARAGVGQFVLLDDDKVTETNLATQQTYRKDIGRFKVDCIAERILDINPDANVIVLPKRLDDLTDYEIRQYAFDPIGNREARRSVICGLTDNFFAQARVNRLALKFGLPSLCAQVYKEGRGGEVTFTFPGITPACHRCALNSRYRYFLEQGQHNDVTSDGTPIFSTTRLNAIKGFVMLALLHHGSNHPRWGKMLVRIGNRNLVLVRMDPDIEQTLGMPFFSKVLKKADQQRLFFDEVVWLPQEPDCPENGFATCPDCGGTGDLTNAIGKFRDTTQLVETNVPKAMVDFMSKYSN